MHKFYLQVFTDPERNELQGVADIVLRPAANPMEVFSITHKYFKEDHADKFCNLVSADGEVLCKYPLH